VSRYAGNPLIVALSPNHSDITEFLTLSAITLGNHFHRAEKIPKFARTGTVAFLIPVQAFRDQLRGKLPQVQIFRNYGTNPLT